MQLILSSLSPLLFLILIIDFQTIQTQQAEFLKLKNQMEKKVKWIKTKFQDSYAKRCETNFLNCQNKSFNICNGTGTRECLINFPSPEKCLPQGIYFSQNDGVRFPNLIDTENLTDQQKQFLCVSTELHSTFSQILQENNNRHSYTFVGSPTGGVRVQPSFLHRDSQRECENYDPRGRPWYSSAVSGAKIIILFIDISQTMKRISSRFTQAKNAAEAILTTMGSYDEVGVISFSEGANILGNFTSLATANQINKKTLINQVKNLQAKDLLTNYKDAFQVGISLYQESHKGEMICKKSNNKSDLIFLFITDGNPNSGEQLFQNLSNFLDSKLLKLNTTLTFIGFAFGQPENTNFSVIQQMACKYGGFVQNFHGDNTETLISKVQNYYDFFWQSTINSKPFWTDPYEDAFGLGNIVTVSIPIFQQKDTNGLSRLIGVAGIDVLMSQFTKFDFTEEQVKEMLQKQKTCYSREGLEECQLQGLRTLISKDIEYCGPQNCFIDPIQTCNYSSEVFMEAIDTTIDLDKCCSLSKIELAMIILGIIVFIGIIAGVVCYQRRRIHRSSQPSQSNRDIPTIYEAKTNSELITLGEGKYERAKEDGIQIYDEEPIDF